MRVQNHSAIQMEAQLQKLAEARNMARKRIMEPTPQQKLAELIEAKQNETKGTSPNAAAYEVKSPEKPAVETSGIVRTTLKKANEMLLYNQDSTSAANNTDPQTRGHYIDLVA